LLRRAIAALHSVLEAGRSSTGSSRAVPSASSRRARG